MYAVAVQIKGGAVGNYVITAAAPAVFVRAADYDFQIIGFGNRKLIAVNRVAL